MTFAPLPAVEYEPRRRQALRDIQEHKQGRRMQLADDVSLLWESRRTVAHQVQEMARMEGDDPEALASILKEYEELEPGPGRLTATLFVEVRDNTLIKERLRHYAGLERSLVLHTSKGSVRPVILGDHGTPEATTAVTYLAFDAVAEEGLELEVRHPGLAVRMPLPEDVVDEPY